MGSLVEVCVVGENDGFFDGDNVGWFEGGDDGLCDGDSVGAEVGVLR